MPSGYREGNQDRLIVHCGHHKCLTVYFFNVLTAVAKKCNLQMYHGQFDNLPDSADIYFQDQSVVDLRKIKKYIGSHVVRDPRDIVVSGYFYHRKCEESWCVLPNSTMSSVLTEGRSYQDMLLSLPIEEGIQFEMETVARYTLNNMANWNYDDPWVMELRYDDIVGNEVQVMSKVFNWYGFGLEEIKEFQAVFENNSLATIKKRWQDKKLEKIKKHIGTGRSGEWRKYFTPDHIKYFKQAYGGLLLKLGYETSPDWK